MKIAILAACASTLILTVNLAHAEYVITFGGSLAGQGVPQKPVKRTGTSNTGAGVTAKKTIWDDTDIAHKRKAKTHLQQPGKSGTTFKIPENESPRPSDR